MGQQEQRDNRIFMPTDSQRVTEYSKDKLHCTGPMQQKELLFVSPQILILVAEKYLGHGERRQPGSGLSVVNPSCPSKSLQQERGGGKVCAQLGFGFSAHCVCPTVCSLLGRWGSTGAHSLHL